MEEKLGYITLQGDNDMHAGDTCHACRRDVPVVYIDFDEPIALRLCAECIARLASFASESLA